MAKVVKIEQFRKIRQKSKNSSKLNNLSKIENSWQNLSKLNSSSNFEKFAKNKKIRQNRKIHEQTNSLKISVTELQQALRKIGRDDIVHRMNKMDLDSEGDSLRLADSSNLTRSQFTSKSSVDRREPTRK